MFSVSVCPHFPLSQVASFTFELLPPPPHSLWTFPARGRHSVRTLAQLVSEAHQCFCRNSHIAAVRNIPLILLHAIAFRSAGTQTFRSGCAQESMHLGNQKYAYFIPVPLLKYLRCIPPECSTDCCKSEKQPRIIVAAWRRL